MASPKYRSGRTRKIGIAVLGILLSVGGLIYAFYGIDFDELYETRTRIDLVPLLGSLATYWLGLVFLRALMVRHLLANAGTVRIGHAYRCLCIGFLANNTLPFRMGDIARSGAIARGANIRFPSVIGGLALERMMDMAMVALIAFITIQVAPLPENLKLAATITALVIGVGFVVLFILGRTSQGKAESSKGGLLGWVWNIWLRFSSGFSALQSMRGVIVFVLLGVAMWGFGIVSMLFKLESFGLDGTLANSLILMTCLGFGVSLPSAPGYVGVYHAAAAFALGIMGVEPAVATAFGLYSWFVDVSVGNVAGAIGMGIEGMKISDLRKSPPE